MIEVREVDAFYGRAQALFGVSFEVQRGEVVALLGRNGAGKSTTMKTLMGLIPPRSGSIHLAGARVDGQPAYRICRRGLGYVPEDRRIFAGLTVEENLEVGRRPPRADAPRWTVPRLFELFPNLGRMRNRRGGEMSGGEQQMLTIARTLMGQPLAVLLDEPSEGLAPVIVTDLAKAISELKREGMTVLLSEQNLRFAAGITDRVFILERGTVRFSGTWAQADASAREQFLAV